jgi:carbonic anhydrase
MDTGYAGSKVACKCHPVHVGPQRRSVLRATIGSIFATFGMVGAPQVWAQSDLTPAEALRTLMLGNERFIENRLVSFTHDLAILRQRTVEKQEPFAAVLSCADSRVPVELIFDQSIGHIFVTRVAGNVATAEIIASLEYGAAQLGTKTILVLGHAGCGAVKAAMTRQPVPGQISTLYRLIHPAVERAKGDFDIAVKDNARIQANLLRDTSPVLGDLVKKGKLTVNAGYYDIASGRVTLLS